MLEHVVKTGDYSDLPSLLETAIKYAGMEDDVILNGSSGFKGLTSADGVLAGEISDWSGPGKAFEELSRAYISMLDAGVKPPVKLFVSPKRYLRLLSIHQGGVVEARRIREFIDDIVVVPRLPDDTALLIAMNEYYLDLIIATDTRIDYIGLEKNMHVFRIWETLALRIKNPKAITVLKQK
jgi:uncharacterized linocin/CFP29 family protein